jgi:hypothetical protein
MLAKTFFVIVYPSVKNLPKIPINKSIPPSLPHSQSFFSVAEPLCSLYLTDNRTGSASGVAIHAQAKASLDRLVCLNKTQVQDDGTSHHAPLPPQAEVLEDLSVDVGNVHDGECGGKATQDSPEQELVVADGLEDGEGAGPARVHAEQTAVEVLHLPGRDK